MNTNIQIPDWYKDVSISIDERIVSFLRYQRNGVMTLKLWYEKATEGILENRDPQLINACDTIIRNQDTKLSYHDEHILDLLMQSYRSIVTRLIL